MEVVFRHNSKNPKLPKTIGYDKEQREYLKLMKNLEADNYRNTGIRYSYIYDGRYYE